MVKSSGKQKDFGQVFTPREIVIDILDLAGYYGDKILEKHIIDNSCGDGAFLVEILKRYVNEYTVKNGTLMGVEEEIAEYIHGIEIDQEIQKACLENLRRTCNELGLGQVNFDIQCADTMKVNKYDGKMDYVIGNPPYVRVHNLRDRYRDVKKYLFAGSGMTDLYIVFFEIGLNMLKKRGVLCYITPNSFYNSVAGKTLRQFLMDERSLAEIVDVGHYQPFSVMTYTAISKIVKGEKFSECRFSKYDMGTGKPKFVANIRYEDLFMDGKIILSENNEKFRAVLEFSEDKLKARVKNGFATLNDEVFIGAEFDFPENQIEVLKSSTGQWKKCVFPYDENGKLMDFDQLSGSTKEYLLKNKVKLDKEKDAGRWYGFGRSQAINDVGENKISINTTIRDLSSIKLNLVEAGKGVYSGLYILTDVSFERIRNIVKSEDFIEYLKVLNKCKSGGYYSFSSRDLSNYINYNLKEHA